MNNATNVLPGTLVTVRVSQCLTDYFTISDPSNPGITSGRLAYGSIVSIVDPTIINTIEPIDSAIVLPRTDPTTLARLSGVLDGLEKEIAVGAKVPTLDLSNPFTKTLVNAALDWEAHDSTNNEQLLKSSINAYKASDEYKTLARTLGTAVERIVDLNTRPEMTTEQVRNIIDDLTHLIKE